MFSVKSFLAVATVAATSVVANHGLTLNNRCSFGVNFSIDNWSRTPYNGAQPPTIAAGKSWSTTLPAGWDGRICDNRNCWGTYSMTEFNLDSNGQSSYDISNIEGFSVGQQIVFDGGQTTTCTNKNCDCTQAYAPGNTGGKCPGSTAPDRAVRNSANASGHITVNYCP